MNTQCWVRPMLVNVTSPFTLFDRAVPSKRRGDEHSGGEHGQGQ